MCEVVAYVIDRADAKPAACRCHLAHFGLQATPTARRSVARATAFCRQRARISKQTDRVHSIGVGRCVANELFLAALITCGNSGLVSSHKSLCVQIIASNRCMFFETISSKDHSSSLRTQ